MANYLLLFSGGGMPESKEAQDAVLQAWGTWYSDLGEALVDGGNPFSPLARNISDDGVVSDLPAEDLASGYSIIAAESSDEAVEMAKGCPVLQGGGKISVFETFEM